MKDLFTAEDFNSCVSLLRKEANVLAAIIANEKLRKEAEKWPVVYGQQMHMENYIKWTESENSRASFKARLAFIEEIKKEPCKHTVISYEGAAGLWTLEGECARCGV